MGGRKTKRTRKRQQRRKQTRKVMPVVETHSFKSSMTFDGNTLTTKTQKDNEPVVERRYTRKELAREIPIGKEMVDVYLDGKMPKELEYHHHHHKHKPKMFTNVLISPADLGLLPPRVNKTMRRQRQYREDDREDDDDDNDREDDRDDDENEMQLLIDDYDDRDSYRTRRRIKRPRKLFDLP